jgi:hypothetical protein
MSLNSQIVGEIEEFKDFVKSAGSIAEAQFDSEFHGRLWNIEKLSRREPEQRSTLMAVFLNATTAELESGLLCSHSRTKPLGYAGDHVLIDMIYLQPVADSDTGRMMDEFFHRQKAPTAVRNRKSFLSIHLLNFAKEKRHPLSLILPVALAGMLLRLLMERAKQLRVLRSIASIWIHVRLNMPSPLLIRTKPAKSVGRQLMRFVFVPRKNMILSGQ